MQGHPGAPAMMVCLPCSTARLSVTSSLPSSPLLSSPLSSALLLLRALYLTSAEKEGAGGQAREHFQVTGFIWVLDLGMDTWVHTCGSLLHCHPYHCPRSAPCRDPEVLLSDRQLQRFCHSALQLPVLIPHSSIQ